MNEALLGEAVKDVGAITKFKFEPATKMEFVITPKSGNGEISVDIWKFPTEKECKEAYLLATGSVPVILSKPHFEVGIEALWSDRGPNFGLSARFADAVLNINGSYVSPELAKLYASR